jgi:hypothetical protein
MPKRHSHTDIDSLDLMLDTVCDIFGGIIFIAMLVTILTTFTSSVIRAQTKDQRQTLDQIRQSTQLQSLTDQVDSLRESAAAADALSAFERDPKSITDEAQRLAAQKRIQERLKKEEEARRETQRAMENIQASREEIQRKITEYQAWLKTHKSKVTDGHKELQARLDDTLQKAQEAQFKLADYTSSRQLQTRLPVEQVSKKDQISMILRYGKVFLFTDSLPTQFQERFKGQIAHTPMLYPRFQAQAIQDMGITVPEAALPAELLEIFKTCPPSAFSINMFVYPDSVAAYRTIRTLGLASGYQYQLWPITDNGPVNYELTNKPTVQ